MPKRKARLFQKLPGSHRQRNRARNLLHCESFSHGWRVWGGENVHFVEKVGTELACDCDVFNKENKLCSHIIKVQMSLGIFPERGRYPA
jgi:hypothetical protein